MNMDKCYDFKQSEEEILTFWQHNNYFNNYSNNKQFTISYPPPNLSGIVHIGHCLNGTLQDIIVRIKRMQGHKISWMLGVDHAGISAQYAVIKKLARDNINVHDMTKEELLKEIHMWTFEQKNTKINQLKKIGLSCSNITNQNELKYTLDPKFADSVKLAFVRLYNDNLIYRSKYITNWCAKCQTVLSNDEVNKKESNGYMYVLKYFLKNEQINENNEYIEIATTRPETIFGDSAICINPTDDRYIHLLGRECYVPIIKRVIPIIASNEVKKDFGTGIMKITPAHDKLDYKIFQSIKSIKSIKKFNKSIEIHDITDQ